MKIAIIGSGGREHALTWKLREDPQISDIFCLPGNAGTAGIAENISVNATDINAISSFVSKCMPDLVVIGPEGPLSLGLADKLVEDSHTVFGPSKEGSRLESSKNFAKQIMYKYGIPTGKAQSFTDPEKAKEYCSKVGYPLVVKADGLAAGKGVSICSVENEAYKAIEECLIDKNFGNAGDHVLIEEFLEGQEVSLLCFTDGKSYIPMVPSQDHKAIYDGDKGPNTGGMGCYSPVPVFTKELEKQSIEEVVGPVIEAFKHEDIDFRGVLYCGLILTNDGLKVLEFNARFGDPETQVILPRMESNLTEVLFATANKELAGTKVSWLDNTCVTVVLASKGYPKKYETGFPIQGIEEAEKDPNINVFHAGTALKENQIVTAGGRVLNVTATGRDFNEARTKAYSALEKIEFEGKYNRTDIGLRAINQDKQKEEQHCLK